MASVQPPSASSEQEVTIKLAVDGANRKFKLPLQDVTLSNFAPKIRSVLKLSEQQPLIIERFSDSSATYILLDPSNPSTYKQLYRAARAKGKLRLRAHTQPLAPAPAPAPVPSSTPCAPEQPAADVRPLDPETDAISAAEKLPIAAAKPAPSSHSVWQVFCNNCEKRLPNVHFHCSICDHGDYDLCEKCVESGVLCPGEGHWLIKRFFRNGLPVNSSTERIAPKPRTAAKPTNVPGSYAGDLKPFSLSPLEPYRTCNGCVRALPEKLLVTCAECDDYDLCFPCFGGNMHGHHPAHSFNAITSDAALSDEMLALCSTGRNQKHFALCDGCDKSIVGVRNKCLDCPDWDFCSECYKSAEKTHPGHRFVPAYAPIASASGFKEKHTGIYCDGPLCSNKPRQTYISGVRYKCGICDDTDFCASCEAHPDNKHNKTHPMVKFKTPVDHVTVTSTGESADGTSVTHMGDKRKARPAVPRSISPDQVVPVPTGATQESVDEKIPSATSEVIVPSTDPSPGIDAEFIGDLIEDGSHIAPDQEFVQVWQLRNSGFKPWPVGCYLSFAGGDFMLDTDRTRPVSTEELNKARMSLETEELVYPGQDFPFKIKLRAPSREGLHVSYWRLKTPEGRPFGHKLWVHIVVSKEAHCRAVLTEIPPPGCDLWGSRLQLALLQQQSDKQALNKTLPTSGSKTPSAAQLALALRPPPSHVATRECPMMELRSIHAGRAQIQAQKTAVKSLNALLEQRDRESLIRTTAARNVSVPSAPRSTASSERTQKRVAGPLSELRASSSSSRSEASGDEQKQRAVGPLGELRSRQSASPTPRPSSAASDAAHRAMLAHRVRVQEWEAQVSKMRADLNKIRCDAVEAPVAKPEVVFEESTMKRDPVNNDTEETMKGSTMVFPTLEKESPSSSTHQDNISMHTAPSVVGDVPRSSVAPTVTEAETMTERDLDELDLSDDETGILTDDEFEILTASDTNA